MLFPAYEFVVTDQGITETGRVEYYEAPTRAKATEYCLYTHRLQNGAFKLGPSRFTVNGPGKGYAVMPPQERGECATLLCVPAHSTTAAA